MKKRLMSLGLAAVMAMSLTACGNSGSGDGASDSKAADGQEAGAEGEVFVLGGIGPITGAGAAYGESVRNGVELAVKEINEAGGINGYQVEFYFEDDENDAEKSVNAYNTLKDKGMQMLVGTTTSKPCIAVGAESAADNMFQLTPSGSAVQCVENENVFRVCFSDPDQGKKSAQYIGEHKLATKVAVIYDSSDTYSTGIYESFKSEAANQGIEVVAEGAFTADNKTDFSVPLQQAQAAGAELLFLPIYYTEASLIITQANKMGYAPQFFGCDGLDGLIGVENFDQSLAEGVMLLTPFSATSDDEKSKAFVDAYEAANKDEVPNQFAADSYDAVYALKAAIEESKATPDMSASDMCDALKGAMTKIKMQGLTGGKDGLTWNESGEVTKSPKAVIIKNGAYKAM